MTKQETSATDAKFVTERAHVRSLFNFSNNFYTRSGFSDLKLSGKIVLKKDFTRKNYKTYHFFSFNLLEIFSSSERLRQR